MAHEDSKSAMVAVRKTLGEENWVMGSMNRNVLVNGMDLGNEASGESHYTLHAASRSLGHDRSADRSDPDADILRDEDEGEDDAHRAGVEGPAVVRRSSSRSRSWRICLS